MITDAKRRYMKEYCRRPYVKEKARRYLQHPEVKKRRRLYMREYRQRPGAKERILLKVATHRQCPIVREHRRHHAKEYYQRPDVKDQRLLYAKEYRQQPTTKLLRRKYRAKEHSKGFTPICPDVWNCPVDYHHISPVHPYVVPLPREIHRSVGGQYHFVYNASMICLLYGLDTHSFSDLAIIKGENQK